MTDEQQVVQRRKHWSTILDNATEKIPNSELEGKCDVGPQPLQSLRLEPEEKSNTAPEEVHSQYQGPISQEVVTEVDQKKTSPPVSGKLHICPFCGRGFAQASNLNKHIRVVHEKLKPHPCEGCEKSFSQKSVAKTHYRAVHLKLKPFICFLCNRPFSDKSNLKKHVRLVHLRERRYQCVECGNKFGEKRSLNDHVSSVHLKRKPFQCPIEECLARFGQKSHLSTHIKSQHGE